MIFDCVGKGRGRVSARRPTCFLLLRQKKVGKEKATPLAVSPALRYGATCDARSWGGAAELTSRLAALRSNNRSKSDHEAEGMLRCPQPAPRPALLGTARGDQSPIRAIAALGLGARACWRLPDTLPLLGPPPMLALPTHASPSGTEASTRVWAGSIQCGWVQAGPGHIAFSNQLRPVAPKTQGRAQRWPVWCPTPFWMRLGRGAGGVNRAPKDARAWCSNWPQLSERGCAAAK